MNGISLLQDLLETIIERGAAITGIRNDQNARASVESLTALCDTLLTARGEASGVALSSLFLHSFAELDDDEKIQFFQAFSERYDPSHEDIRKAAEQYADEPSVTNLVALEEATQTPRRKILRRVNLAPGGTAALVHMREQLIPLLRNEIDLNKVDHDFLQLFRLWFNRGFLVLRQIDWNTPANILEKIIAYEAVHEIQDWDELRRRVLPEDRRCFAFFHPSMPDDPLIFVEVALTETIPDSIQNLLTEEREHIAASAANTAVFYSISNCQQGLSGVSFGSFLIKRVAQSLSKELPNLDNFVTLSPIPGFRKWLENKAQDKAEIDAYKACNIIRQREWQQDEEFADEAKSLLKPLAVEYFVAAKNKSGEPLNSVARFHLGNGASLHRINFLGDSSIKGMEQSAGLMVNYLYKLDDIETNHEAYADHAEICVSKDVRSIAPRVFAEK